jgi:polyribonucleotide nucleotidyltransferase
VIRSIVEETGVKIDVEDDGSVKIFASDGESAKLAMQRWPISAPSPKLAKPISGKVVRLAEFGAFVEIFPGTDGLLHISEISENRIKPCATS